MTSSELKQKTIAQIVALFDEAELEGLHVKVSHASDRTQGYLSDCKQQVCQTMTKSIVIKIGKFDKDADV